MEIEGLPAQVGEMMVNAVRVIECAWGKVGADGVVTHPAERVSFTQNKQGSWDKASALALGDVDTLPNYTAPPPVKSQLDTIVEKLAGLEAKLNTIETQTKP